jgi:transcription elongation factor Elf1
MKLRCPRCQQKLTVADKFAGRGVRCPACNRAFNVPIPKASTSTLADKVDLDLEGLASLEQQSSELDKQELKAVEKVRKAKEEAEKPDPHIRTCPACGKPLLTLLESDTGSATRVY